MLRVEPEETPGGTRATAERFAPPWPLLLNPWLGLGLALLVCVLALLCGELCAERDWIDIAGEGFVLAIAVAAYARATRATLARGVRIPLMLGLLLLVAATAADWIDEFVLASASLNVIENFGLIAGGPCVLYALFIEERRRGRESSRLQRQAQHFESMALQDALTGVGNRRAFDQHFARRAQGGGFALLLLDLDGFKRINDEHGHDVGDAILRLTGGLLRDVLREGDRAYRYGGEEFALIVETADPAPAREVAERLRAGFARLEHPAFEPGAAPAFTAA